MPPNERLKASSEVGKAGFVAIIGRPNAGKSTLLNLAAGLIEASRVSPGAHFDIGYEIIGTRGMLRYSYDNINDLYLSASYCSHLPQSARRLLQA